MIKAQIPLAPFAKGGTCLSPPLKKGVGGIFRIITFLDSNMTLVAHLAGIKPATTRYVSFQLRNGISNARYHFENGIMTMTLYHKHIDTSMSNAFGELRD